ALLLRHAAEYAQITSSRADEASMRAFFGGAMELETFPNRQTFDFEGLKGRLMPSSYAPGPGHPPHAPMLAGLRALSGRHAQRGGAAEPVVVACMVPSGFARQAHHERAILAGPQALECAFNLRDVGERGHAARASAQLTGSLRAAQQQLAHERELLRGELECSVLGVAETVLVFRNPTAEARLLDHEVLSGKLVQGVLNRALVHLHDRIAIALLVARIHQSVERQGVLVRCRDVLLDEAADNARLECRQLDVHCCVPFTTRVRDPQARGTASGPV